jgi:hypothetical protein
MQAKLEQNKHKTLIISYSIKEKHFFNTEYQQLGFFTDS